MKIRKILLCRNGKLGDVVLISGAVPLLQEIFPGARIDAFVSAECSEILTPNEGFAQIYAWSYHQPLPQRLSVLAKLRKNRYDLVITFETGDRQVVTSRLIGGSYRFAFESHFSFFMHRTVPYYRNRHVTSNHLALIQQAATFLHRRKSITEDQLQKALAAKKMATTLVHTAEERAKAKKFLLDLGWNGKSPLAAIQALTSGGTTLRRWIPEHIIQAVNTLHESGIQILFTGHQNELKDLNELAEKCAQRPLVFPDVDIPPRMLSSIIAVCAALIVGDTGPMHIAAATQTPVVALFGFTDANNTGPAGLSNKIIVLDKKFSCSPCKWDPSKPERKKCEQQQFGDCMLAITPHEVCQAVLKLIN
jgi:ADP-heptose:LPS heptosyltransferase